MVINSIKKTINSHIFLKKIIRKLLNEFKRGHIRQIFHYTIKGHVISKLKIFKYFKKNAIKKLQIGGGSYLKKGWLNGDILGGDIYLNAADKFPIKSGSLDYIFAEQFIEHLDFESGKKCLEECYRVLKPTGVIRIATPDLNGLFSVYNNNNSIVNSGEALTRHRSNHNKDCLNLCHFINDNFRLWGHSFIYDFETLESVFKNIGFKSINHVNFGISKFPELNGLEIHADTEWMKSAYQIIIEVKKSHE